TLSHEPGVGFAADGYARATGRIGVVCVTYGAGGHNMVNPVAGSFSERVPVLVISGGPGEEERKLGTLIHHQAKEIESQLRIYRELTCAARVIDYAATAAATVADVVRTVWREQSPGSVETHRASAIWAVGGRVNVSFHTYTDVHIRDFVHGLRRAPLRRHRENVRYCDNLPAQPPETKRGLRVTDVLHEVNRFLRDRRGYMVVA